MQGLRDAEQRSCREILEALPTADLMSLKDTVTKGLIAVESRQEAIHAILTYSQSAEELLKRKKVSRDIIFTYLAKYGVVVPPSSEKSVLIQTTLEYWRGSVMKTKVKPEMLSQQIQAVDRPTDKHQQVEKLDLKGTDYQALGEQFCQWFYQLWNSQNPSLGLQQGNWGPQHFWKDTKLKFRYYTSEENCEEFLGAELTSLRLLALVKDECLIFNPNMDGSGLKCVSSPHGLVVVAVAGTVHREIVCLGIFEQIFGLIRSPLDDNNWKIKFVNLKIKGQNALEAGSSLLRPVVEYKNSELEVFYD